MNKINNVFINNVSKTSVETGIKKNSQQKVEQEQTEASSMQAQGSYGRAFVNMSFKGTVALAEETKELTPEEIKKEFEALGFELNEDEIKLINRANIALAKILYTDTELDFPKEKIGNILRNTSAENTELATRLCTDKELDFPPDCIGRTIEYVTPENEELANSLIFDKELNFPKDKIYLVLREVDEENIKFAIMYYTDKGNDFSAKVRSDFSNALLHINDNSIELATRLYLDKELGFTEDEILGYRSITGKITQKNKDLANFMAKDENLGEYKDHIKDILEATNAENIELAKKLCADKDFPKNLIIEDRYNNGGILRYTNAENIEFATMLCTDKELDFPKDKIQEALRYANKNNIELATKLCTDRELAFPKDQIISILRYTNKDNIELATKLCTDKKLNFPPNCIGSTLNAINSKNEELANRLIFDKELNFPKEQIADVLKNTNARNIELATRLCTSIEMEFSKNYINCGRLIQLTTPKNIDSIICLFNDKELDLPKDRIEDLVCTSGLNAENIKLAISIYTDKELDLSKEEIENMIEYANAENIELATTLCTDRELDFPKDLIRSVLCYANAENIELATTLCTDKELDFPKDLIENVLFRTKKDKIELATKLCTDKELNFPKEQIQGVLFYIDENNQELANRLIFDKELDFPNEQVLGVLRNIDKNNEELANRLIFDKELDFPKDVIADILEYANSNNIKEAEKLVELTRDGELPAYAIPSLLNKESKITLSEIKYLKSIMGKNKVNNLSYNDFKVAVKFSNLYGKTSINEIPLSKKKGILRNLVASNTDLFNISDNLKRDFPLLPANQEEYCSLLPSIVRSLGIETNTLSDDKVQELNISMSNMAHAIAQLSDEEFNNLEIKQEYSKDDFIADTMAIVKDMPKTEMQKVYDYFGFELYYNKDNPNGFSIYGYPVNLNNGKKLAEITNPDTKQIVEQLRPYVIRFSENNKILSDNIEIQTFLNEIIDSFPELRTQIGRVQHSTHSFDSIKHSLKVMQKVAQNPKFNSLSDSDKKLMLLASLFHDSNKIEGKISRTHSDESAFDTFYITNKLNLSHDEKVKLYTLIKNHEWLGYVQKAKTPEDKEQRLKSVAFNLQYNNLFDLSEMFTEADLQSVKKDNSFFENNLKVLNEDSKDIKSYIEELKTTRPLMPVTQFPSADTINKAITTVNDDYSTNIKGVYKDENGLIILKFNEIEDWEAIGFPKGSVSRGISATGVSGTGLRTQEKDIDTGNIKFFAHALDYSNQLAKFDAFALPDSDALLSVSYAERPESKYKFFRPQGVLLNVDSQYAHGGGNTDSGSGYGKDIDIFKKDYAYLGSKRYEDRKYVADLIKDALNLTDEEYVEFVNKNENKAFTEIEPKEVREKIIRAFATINSNIRNGNREYNEMYVSNPKVMGVFAYPTQDGPVNISEFMHNTENSNSFLRDYAIDNNLPFVIFG